MKYQNISGEKVQCLICPRKCRLKEGQRGFCHVRQNICGEIKLTTFGYNTGLCLDPVEKKPLYHFYPGSKVLSFGTIGCNMGCLFCQNYKTTKSKIDPRTTIKTKPEEIVEMALKTGAKGVAFTYNEPSIFFEYVLQTAELCRENNIKTILVTSGYINLEPAKELYSLTDALNIDLKGFSEEFYNKNCLAKLAPVLDIIKYVKNETNCHLELTTLLIEGENDGKSILQRQTDWILENLGCDIPLHFSAFNPLYKFKNKKRTEFKTLFNARKIALDMGLNHVYTGNLATLETSTTYCKKCSSPLIVRNGHEIIENNIVNGLCPFCKTEVYGKF